MVQQHKHLLSTLRLFIFIIIFITGATVYTAIDLYAQSDQPPTTSNAYEPWKTSPAYRRWQRLGDGDWNSQPTAAQATASQRSVQVNMEPQVMASGAEEAAAVALAIDWWSATFQSNRTGNWEIFGVQGNGNQLVQLTFNEAADTQPQLNWATDTIVFVAQRDGNPEIYRMQADGSGQTRLTTHPADDLMPTWSRNGTEITFVSQRDGNAELYRMQADGSNLQRLTNDAVADLFPNWSADGETLVWVKAVDQDGWLWVMNHDGTGAHAISGPLRYLQHPVWSPDGSKIAFDYDADGDGYNELAVFTVADGTITVIQDDSRDQPPRPAFELWMADWSPNGKGITYSVLELAWQPVEGGYVQVLQSVNVAGFCIVDECYGDTFGVAPSHSIIWNLNATVRTRDPYPPETKMQPFPRYMRRGEMYVQWGGVDRGISGIANYDVDVKVDLAADWQSWQRSTDKTGEIPDVYIFGISNAPNVYFRSRATDNAGNQEAWNASPTGDAWTSFYAAILGGQVTDARGIPRTGRAVTVIPAPLMPVATDQQGRFQSYLPLDGEYQLQNVRVDAKHDLWYTWYDLPANNLLSNGDFESSGALGPWQAGGTIAPQVSKEYVHRGAQSVQLGNGCTVQCLITDTTMPLPAGYTLIPLTTQDSRLHFAATFHDNSKLVYLVRAEDGTWSTPETIYNGPLFALTGVGDKVGNLHLFWQIGFDQEARIIYQYRPVGGQWGPPAILANGRKPQVAIGADGKVHLLYFHCAEYCLEQFLYYRQFSPDGVIVAQNRFPVGSVYDDAHQIAVTNDGVVHLIWPERNEANHSANGQPLQLLYSTLKNNSLVVNRTLLFEKVYLDRLRLLHTADDTLHLFWDSASWMQKPAGQPWSSPARVANDVVTIMSDTDGSVRLLMRNWSEHPFIYITKQAVDQPWSIPQSLPSGNQSYASLFLSPNHQLLATTVGGAIHQTPLVETAGTSAIAQSVEIPAQMYHPTLSWMAAIDGPAMANSTFQVELTSAVSATLTTTVLYSTTAAAPWHLAWADLTPWAGETVTITFVVSQAAGEMPFYLYLDDIALGAWTTPVPQVVSPAQVDWGVAATVTISGENFIDTPAVKVGDITLANVTRRSEQALVVALPTTLPPGLHDITVRNPDGTTTILPSALAVGRQLYLPTVAR